MRTHPARIALLAAGLVPLLAFGGCSPTAAGPLSDHPRLNRPAPEFTHREASAWLNSPPLSLSRLRGNVVFIDVWTFACWNCYRSFPWLRAMEARFKDRRLRVIGVHTPEFAREKVRANVARHVKKYKLEHPVMMDNDFSYWRALGNRYWPAFYIVDKQGLIRAVYAGETHPDTPRAKAIEATIEKLLAEPG